MGGWHPAVARAAGGLPGVPPADCQGTGGVCSRRDNYGAVVIRAGETPAPSPIFWVSAPCAGPWSSGRRPRRRHRRGHRHRHRCRCWTAAPPPVNNRGVRLLPIIASLVSCDGDGECVPEEPPLSDCSHDMSQRFACDGCGGTWACNYSFISDEPSEWLKSDVKCSCIDDSGVQRTDWGGCELTR